MSRSAVALLIVLTAIFGYFSMVGVAILSRGAPENNFQTPQSSIAPPREAPIVLPSSDLHERAEPTATGAQE
ncbi:hypothetical protein [Blastopirellula marina]|uniref:Uncharacterized protein n=1 Tax=Blastopirellula marina DSM 3645 TaxID=314230 RepID=A4A2Z7_9BACT|nr:hypothetical protein [Blastopirellula marina]EAQ76857.1 hypothetical protein DSM3645_15785 [Blastopirellula marina DSM 3645]